MQVPSLFSKSSSSSTFSFCPERKQFVCCDGCFLYQNTGSQLLNWKIPLPIGKRLGLVWSLLRMITTSVDARCCWSQSRPVRRKGVQCSAPPAMTWPPRWSRIEQSSKGPSRCKRGRALTNAGPKSWRSQFLPVVEYVLMQLVQFGSPYGSFAVTSSLMNHDTELNLTWVRREPTRGFKVVAARGLIIKSLLRKRERDLHLQRRYLLWLRADVGSFLLRCSQ